MDEYCGFTSRVKLSRQKFRNWDRCWNHYWQKVRDLVNNTFHEIKRWRKLIARLEMLDLVIIKFTFRAVEVYATFWRPIRDTKLLNVARARSSGNWIIEFPSLAIHPHVRIVIGRCRTSRKISRLLTGLDLWE